VGGTNYYIESIVYNILVEDTDDAEALLWDRSRKRDLDEPERSSEVPEKKSHGEPASETDVADKALEVAPGEPSKEKLQEDVQNESKFTNEEIHDKLKSIDPVMAERLHPNNRRKVLR
jgi:hypothetical protein